MRHSYTHISYPNELKKDMLAYHCIRCKGESTPCSVADRGWRAYVITMTVAAVFELQGHRLSTTAESGYPPILRFALAAD